MAGDTPPRIFTELKSGVTDTIFSHNVDNRKFFLPNPIWGGELEQQIVLNLLSIHMQIIIYIKWALILP